MTVQATAIRQVRIQFCDLLPGIAIVAIKLAARTVHTTTSVTGSSVSYGLSVVACCQAPARRSGDKKRTGPATQPQISRVRLPRSGATHIILRFLVPHRQGITQPITFVRSRALITVPAAGKPALARIAGSRRRLPAQAGRHCCAQALLCPGAAVPRRRCAQALPGRPGTRPVG
jgi:hypothetical protein